MPIHPTYIGDMVRLWNRLIRMPEERITKKVFTWDTTHNYPWAREMLAIFYEADLQYVFRNRLPCDVTQFKTKMFLNYKERWATEIWLKPKLRTYVLIKDTYSPEPYVYLNLTRSQRSVCAQIRSGTLPLAIETGRFYGTPEEDRLCLLCDLGEVENEIHFVFHCPMYDDLRHDLFEKVFRDHPESFWLRDETRLELFFRIAVFDIARYIQKAWERRKAAIFK